MRGFLITACLFMILIICIVLNYNYVNDVHNTMHTLTEQITPYNYEKNWHIIDKLYSYWDKQNTLLSISVSFREIDDLYNDLDSLLAANRLQDDVQISIYKERLQNSIDAIMRLEHFSIKSII